VSLLKTNLRSHIEKKHFLETNKLEINLEFIPTSVNAYLNENGKKIDEINYYDYKPMKVNQFPRRQRRIDVIEEFDDEYEEKNNLFGNELVSKLPAQIQSLIIEAENAFNSHLYRATLILFRCVIEEGITVILKQIGKTNEMYADKHEVGLGTKIKMIIEYVPSFAQVKGELRDVKWFGDKATHEAQMPINEHDISTNLEPKMRLILTKFVEELS